MVVWNAVESDRALQGVFKGIRVEVDEDLSDSVRVGKKGLVKQRLVDV